MHKQQGGEVTNNSDITPTYASRLLNSQISKYKIADASIAPDIAYRLISDELQLDGNAKMNLATFVTTWMEPEVTKLMAKTFNKNIIDKDEYPQTAEIESRCISILADLWNSPSPKEALGTSTIGSSEGCMLAGLALKWQWREKMKSKGLDSIKPNLVLGINAQICWDKFCKYWDVEPRYVPLQTDRYHIDPYQAVKMCDENTIGVIGIMGSTFDGSYEPISAISEALDSLQETSGLDIPIHVDAASGGFIAPFLQSNIIWDFRLIRVKSINTSGHKYGLVYPGIGWVIWRHPNDLPKDLIFYVDYLGGQIPTFTLNFSKPGNTVIAQYYNFIRLGREGYHSIQKASQDTAVYLSSKIANMGYFCLLSDGSDIPTFAFRLNNDVSQFNLYDLSDRLRMNGWQLPTYTMPKNIEGMVVMRIVVKEDFSRDMADKLLLDISNQISWLISNPRTSNKTSYKNAFHH